MTHSSRSTSRRLAHRLVTLIPPVVFGLAAAATLAGCPVGAELEDPDRFPIIAGGTGPGTGGAGPATGGTGPTTGGTGPTTGGAAGSGTAGAGGGAIVTPNITCDGGADYVATLTENCARTGCHNTRSHISNLDLTPDAGLAMRLKNKPAGFAEIDCGAPGPYMECVPATCPPPADTLLVNSANPDASWILRKINGTHNDCGVVMPVAPGDRPPAPAGPFDDARKACLDKLVRAIAAL
jgi:hypothetical protein